MYWGIPFVIEACCEAYFNEEVECVEATRKAQHLKKAFKKDCKDEEMERTKFAKIKVKIWNLFENPETSLAAKVS